MIVFLSRALGVLLFGAMHAVCVTFLMMIVHYAVRTTSVDPIFDTSTVIGYFLVLAETAFNKLVVLCVPN